LRQHLSQARIGSLGTRPVRGVLEEREALPEFVGVVRRLALGDAPAVGVDPLAPGMVDSELLEQGGDADRR
jgi:hypothetical protein